MDPSATLSTIRTNLQILLHGEESDGADLQDVTTETLEAMESLDEWLSRGGFLPNAWDPDSFSNLLRGR